MRLSECKGFEDLKEFCESPVFYYLNGEGKTARLKGADVEFFFDKTKKRISWRNKSVYGDELYNSSCEADLAEIRLAIKTREDAVKRMTREIEELRPKELEQVRLVRNFKGSNWKEDEDGAGKED
ncbi:MAG: hypothetical protein J6Y62_03915 [Clostridia bacterium]|nr:hypothetical protein [Clostridia bacterium]